MSASSTSTSSATPNYAMLSWEDEGTLRKVLSYSKSCIYHISANGCRLEHNIANGYFQASGSAGVHQLLLKELIKRNKEACTVVNTERRLIFTQAAFIGEISVLFKSNNKEQFKKEAPSLAFLEDFEISYQTSKEGLLKKVDAMFKEILTPPSEKAEAKETSFNRNLGLTHREGKQRESSSMATSSSLTQGQENPISEKMDIQPEPELRKSKCPCPELPCTIL